jgi:prepilin-type processing-associated H-X9-DG protein
MLIKRKMSRIVFVTLCCFVTLNVFAASASKGSAQILKPCIDDQTFAIIHVDIGKLNLNSYIEMVRDLVSQQARPDIAENIQNDIKNFQDQAGTQLNDLTKLGANDIYVVFSMYDFPYFFVAIPIPSGGNETDLSKQVQLYKQVEKIKNESFSKAGIELYTSDGLILAGLPQTIARLKTMSPVQSDALAKSLQACGDTTVQAALFPTSDQRRILAEMLPQIPAGSGKINFSTVGKDLEWAALGFNGPPSISLNVTIQSQNSDGADNLLTFIKTVYTLAAQTPQAQEFKPQLDQLLKLLTPEKQENKLVLNVEPETANSIIDDFIAPSLIKAREMATRLACGNNLKGIGMALLIYANDYADHFPPNLEILTSTAEVPPKVLVCPSTSQKDSFIYRGSGLTTKADPSMIMVYDKKGNHEGGRNVLFMDGHIEWIPEERFPELVIKDNKYRREKGYPEISAE